MKSFFSNKSKGFSEGSSRQSKRLSFDLGTNLGAGNIKQMMKLPIIGEKKTVPVEMSIELSEPRENKEALKETIFASVKGGLRKITKSKNTLDDVWSAKEVSSSVEQNNISVSPEFHEAAIAFLGKFTNDTKSINEMLNDLYDSYRLKSGSVVNDNITVKMKLQSNDAGDLSLGYATKDDNSNTIVLSSVNESCFIYNNGDVVFGEKLEPVAQRESYEVNSFH